jgi:hypothetical protein
MEGADLVTEGIITLGKVAEILDRREPLDRGKPNPAAKLADLLLDSDVIDFVVGTKDQRGPPGSQHARGAGDPPQYRQTLAAILEEKYLKETRTRFI